MPIRNHIFEYIKSQTSQILQPSNERLNVSYAEGIGGWRRVASSVNTLDPSKLMWFPDSNVGILDSADCFWASLRLAAVTAQRETAVLSSSALHEWVEKADSTEQRANDVRNALHTPGGWVKFWDPHPQEDHPYFTAFVYYLRLLAARRATAIPNPDGTGSSIKDLMNEVAQKVGPGGVLLARKGRKDKAKTGIINVNDEVHVLTAIWFAFKVGVETIIVSSDLDCLEIFDKTVHTILQDYMAWSMGVRVHLGQCGNPVDNIPDGDSGFFRGDVQLYANPFSDLQNVLLDEYTPLTVHCVYVHNDNEVYRQTVEFDREISYMLETKGKTRGRNTELFGDHNIRLIDIDTHPIIPKGHYIAIGKDEAGAVEELGVTVDLPLFDVMNTVNNHHDFGGWRPTGL